MGGYAPTCSREALPVGNGPQKLVLLMVPSAEAFGVLECQQDNNKYVLLTDLPVPLSPQNRYL